MLLGPLYLLAGTGSLPTTANYHNSDSLQETLVTLVILAPAVTVGETEGAMDSASVLFFTSSFAYNFARK